MFANIFHGVFIMKTSKHAFFPEGRCRHSKKALAN